MAFVMNSPAFGDGSGMPARYTGDGENLSPPLEWSGAPAETRSFVLVCDDPDAPSGTFRHWGLYNIMGDRMRLPEGVGPGAKTVILGQGVHDDGHPHSDRPGPPKRHGTAKKHLQL